MLTGSELDQTSEKLPKIKIYTFGTLQVVRENHAVTEGDWHTRQARQLLKILITERPRPVSTDRLIEILWPHSTPDAAATTLRSAINALRNVLEPERPNRAPSRYVLTQTPGYAFYLHPDIWLDVDAFEHVLSHAQHTTNAAERQALLEAAVQIYQDDYLVSDPYSDWVQNERERLRERFFTALLHLADLQAQGGHYAEAITTCRMILARDEVRENAYQSLMRYQAESGDSAGALLTYERCRTILADELGADPSPLTQLWHQRILNGEVAPRFAEHPVAQVVSSDGSHNQPAEPAPGVVSLERLTELPQLALMPSQDGRVHDAFVGRDALLASMTELLQGALTGRGDLLLLDGEAGVGKTRLAAALLQQAVAANASVLAATCQTLEMRLPFAPLADMIGRYLHLLPVSALRLLPNASLAQVAQVIPSLVDRVPELRLPAADLASTPEENRQRLIDGVVGFLTTLAQLRPLVLFLDDLQWADAETLAVLGRLTNRLADLPMLLVLAYRSDDLTENDALVTLVYSINRRYSHRQVHVERLTQEQVAEFVDTSTGKPNLFGGELAVLLYATTHGNALFVNESLRDLQERHPELRAVAATPFTLHSDNDRGDMPPLTWSEGVRQTLTLRRNQRVQELIRERIERLPETARWVLQLAAVIGRDFSLELLELAANDDPLAGLDTLLQRKFLIERPDERLDFSHQVVRQVAYDTMNTLQRRRWHRRVADALVALERADRSPAEIAFHYGQSGVSALQPFATYGVAAGELLLATYSFRQAIDYFDQALAAIDQLREIDPGITRRALQGRGLAFESLFDPEGVAESYRRLMDWAGKQGDRELMLTTHSRLASILGLMGQQRESNELLRELMDGLPQIGDSASARSRVIVDLFNRRRLIFSLDAETGSTVWADYTLPPPVVNEPVRDILQVLEPLHAVLPLLDYGWTLLVQGELGEATRCLEAVVDLASDTGQPSIASTALHQLAVTARILGDLEQSQALNEQSVAINREVPGTASELASMWPRIASAQLALQAGRVDEAERRFRRVVDFLGERGPYRNYYNSAMIGLGLVVLARGEVDNAKRLLEQGLADSVNLYPYMHVRALLGLARIARLQGDVQEGDWLLRQALRFAGRRSLLEEYIETLLEIARVRPAGAPVTRLLQNLLTYVRPIGLEVAANQLEKALAEFTRATNAGLLASSVESSL